MSEAKVDMFETLRNATGLCPIYVQNVVHYKASGVKEFLEDFLTDVMHLMSLGIKIRFDFGAGAVLSSDCTNVTLSH